MQPYKAGNSCLHDICVNLSFWWQTAENHESTLDWTAVHQILSMERRQSYEVHQYCPHQTWCFFTEMHDWYLLFYNVETSLKKICEHILFIRLFTTMETITEATKKISINLWEESSYFNHIYELEFKTYSTECELLCSM